MNNIAFKKKKVLVIGDVMIDEYWFGKVARVSPEAPVPVLEMNKTEIRAGGAANVAANVSALGAEVTLIGLVGDDHDAEVLKTKINQLNINTNLICVKNSCTIKKLRIIGQNQQIVRIDFEDGFKEFNNETLVKKLESSIEDYEMIILSDYNKGTLRNSSKIIEISNNHGIPVIVDPKGSDYSKYSGSLMITPNEAEFRQVVGDWENEEIFEQKAKEFLTLFNFPYLLVTRGPKGMSLFNQNERTDFPTVAKEVIDVTGAGDTVIATLGTSIASGISINESVIIANHAAGLVVGKLGTSIISINELNRAFSHHDLDRIKVIMESEIPSLIKNIRESKKNIVFTNGCFDILHSGHIAYLEEAKKLGDVLIVGINTDESVKRLKGQNRPINNLEERMSVLAGLSSIDWIIPFDGGILNGKFENTPTEIIKLIKPDILVKGGDYLVQEVAGKEYAKKTIILDYKKNCSTSNVIERILKLEKL